MSSQPSSPATELRALRPTDADAVHHLLSDPRVLQYMLFPVFDRTRARQFVERFGEEAPVGSPPQIVRGIAAVGDQSLIGLCGLVLDSSGQGELWYLLRPSHWGRGFASTAVRALLEIAFERMALHRIWARSVPENPASVRVLERLGFRREGSHRQNLRIREVWHDSITYAMLRDEWASIQADKGRPRSP